MSVKRGSCLCQQEATHARVMLSDGRPALRKGRLLRGLAVAQPAGADRGQRPSFPSVAVDPVRSMTVCRRAAGGLVAFVGVDDRLHTPAIMQRTALASGRQFHPGMLE